jgi:MFS transporter, OPA family, sugar phosphate sensor protein UhpC
MNFLFKFLKPAPHLEEMTDQEEIKVKYKYWRVRVMYSMFIGYTLYYLTRKSFAFAMPGISENLGLDKGELGVMGTVLALSYGLSKFFSGVISDQSNPRYFMALGLILTGIFNIFLGFSSSLWLFALFWGLNGWFQGFGWPPCVKLLSNWYSHSERGSWWSSWAVSQNVGAFVAPWVVGFCLLYFGWRYAMFVPGIVCIIGGFFLMNRLSDVPRSKGLPSIEKYRNDYPDEKKKGEEEETLSAKERILSVLKNKFIWVLALAYFFIYFIRTGLEWAPFFMIETKGYSMLKANGIASLVEIGGFLGMLSAGWVSDRVFKARRGPVNALFAMLLFSGLVGFWFFSGGVAWIDSALLVVIGFAIFGPQMLIGVAVSEVAHKNSTATATGLAGWVAYIGSAAAGFPLGKIIDYFGWEGFFMSMVISSVVAVLLLVPLWGVTHSPSKKPEEVSVEPEEVSVKDKEGLKTS